MYLITFACFLTMTNAARILGIFPVPIPSHFRYNLAIMKSLDAIGHQVTIVTPFPLKNEADNITYIAMETRVPVFRKITIDDVADKTLSNFLSERESEMTQIYRDVIKLQVIQVSRENRIHGEYTTNTE